jgi:hypothetical protein
MIKKERSPIYTPKFVSKFSLQPLTLSWFNFQPQTLKTVQNIRRVALKKKGHTQYICWYMHAYLPGTTKEIFASLFTSVRVPPWNQDNGDR